MSNQKQSSNNQSTSRPTGTSGSSGQWLETPSKPKRTVPSNTPVVERGALLAPDYEKKSKKAASQRRRQKKLEHKQECKQRQTKEKQHHGDKRLPLIIIDGDADASIVKTWVIIAIMVAIAGGCYALGIWINRSWLITFAFIIVVATVIFWIWQKRASVLLTDDQIEEAVVEYRRDLMKSYEGYDIDIDMAEVNQAVAEYRELLIEENVSLAELSPSMMVETIKESRMRTKKLEEEAKKSR